MKKSLCVKQKSRRISGLRYENKHLAAEFIYHIVNPSVKFSLLLVKTYTFFFLPCKSKKMDLCLMHYKIENKFPILEI